MSRPQYLRHNVINQFVDSIARGHLSSPLPSQNSLAETFNISRTTVRHILQHLVEQHILQQEGRHFVICYIPPVDEGNIGQNLPHEEQQQLFEQAFYAMINQRELRAGERFTELELARATGVNPVVVREFLLKFSRYSLIENEKRGTWRMKKFNQRWAEQLFELREILEIHSLNRFMALDKTDQHWLNARDLLVRHRQLRDRIGRDYRMFAGLDRDFHALLLSAADNIFFNQSLEIISVIFHFHYQWDDSDLKQRNIVAVDQHMMILNAMLAHQAPEATRLLRSHLDTAKQAMIRSLINNSAINA